MSPAKSRSYFFHSTDESLDQPIDRQNASALWGGLKRDTTAHGIPHYSRARGTVKKVFWGIIIALCVGALIVNISILSWQFFSFRVNVIIKMQYEREMTFPAVTVCNANPLRLSEAMLNPKLAELLNTTYNSSSETFRLEETLSEVLASIPLSEKMAMGHQAKDMLLDCQYAGYNCYWDKDFAYLYNPLHGNCYVFNSGWQGKQPLKTSKKTGRRYGLKAIFHLQQDEYLPHVVESAGLLVAIHDHDRMPFPEDEAFVVTPGQLNSVGIRQVQVSRMGQPYGTCVVVEKDHQAIRNVYEELYPVKYSASACQKTCYQRHVWQRCGCSDPRFPLNGTALGNWNQTNVAICESQNTKQVECKTKVDKEYNDNTLTCDCPMECDENSYSLTVSNSRWPSDVYQSKLLTELSPRAPDLVNNPSDTDKFTRNLIKLEVYFEEFNYERIGEKPAYEQGQFVSDLGGVIGLWVGFSVMTMFEFVEFVMDLCVLYAFKLCGKPLSRSTTPVMPMPKEQ